MSTYTSPLLMKKLSPCRYDHVFSYVISLSLFFDLPGLDFWLQIYLLRLLRMSDQDVAKCVRIQILGPKMPSKLNDVQAKPLSQFMSCLLFQSPKPNGLAACGLPVQRFQDLLPLEQSACQTAITAASRIAELLGNTNSLRAI